MSKDDSKNHSYLLATGQKGAKRLNLQNDLLREYSQALLKKAGLKEGMFALDIACGSGVMTSYLAKTVGPLGHVIAVDMSQEQLQVAKEHIASENLKNVTFVQDDILNPQNLSKECADFAYSRFIMMHLRAPMQGARQIKDLLKPGGILASEEPIKYTNYCSYETALFNEFITCVIALGEKLGLNYNIGENLVGLYQEVGFEIVEHYQEQFQIHPEAAKLMFSYALNEFQDKLITAKVATLEQISSWQKLFQTIPTENPNLIIKLARQTYVIARKLF